MSATSNRNTIMDKRFVITRVILSPESGGTLNAKILRANEETKENYVNFHICEFQKEKASSYHL